MVWNKIYFENIRKYYLLMKAFIDKKINGRNFEEEFWELYKIDFENSETLVKTILESTTFTFQPNLKSFGFSDLMSSVSTTCDVFEPRTEKRQYYELSEE